MCFETVERNTRMRRLNIAFDRFVFFFKNMIRNGKLGLGNGRIIVYIL